jgi:hypothetical protein
MVKVKEIKHSEDKNLSNSDDESQESLEELSGEEDGEELMYDDEMDESGEFDRYE